jgi:hypothetical protein
MRSEKEEEEEGGGGVFIPETGEISISSSLSASAAKPAHLPQAGD